MKIFRPLVIAGPSVGFLAPGPSVAQQSARMCLLNLTMDQLQRQDPNLRYVEGGFRCSSGGTATVWFDTFRVNGGKRAGAATRHILRNDGWMSVCGNPCR
jgi:hypothetical protein